MTVMSEALVQFNDGQLQFEHFVLTPDGLTVISKPTYEEWEQLGQLLHALERGVQWLVGDWLNCGESYFGEMAAQVIDHEHWSEESVRNFAWVAAKVPKDNRRRDLSWSHHQAVAALPLDQQIVWLEKAATGDPGDPDTKTWSHGRLKQELHADGDVDAIVRYLLMIEFESPADRDIVANEHERVGRRCRRLESTKPLPQPPPQGDASA